MTTIAKATDGSQYSGGDVVGADDGGDEWSTLDVLLCRVPPGIDPEVGRAGREFESEVESREEEIISYLNLSTNGREVEVYRERMDCTRLDSGQITAMSHIATELLTVHQFSSNSFCDSDSPSSSSVYEVSSKSSWPIKSSEPPGIRSGASPTSLKRQISFT